jgi:hypothetical protein
VEALDASGAELHAAWQELWHAQQELLGLEPPR